MRLVVSKGLEKSGYKYQGSQITRHRRASQQVMDKSDLDLTSQTSEPQIYRLGNTQQTSQT